MLKKTIAFLTVVVMLISLLPITVFADATVPITVTANKTEAVAGDTITFTVSYGAIAQGLGSSEFSLAIPEGLTYVENSGSVTANLATTLMADKAAFTEVPDKKFISYGAAGEGYKSAESLQIMTFQCTVNENASLGNTTITLNISDFSDNDFEDIPYNLVPAIVKIAKKPVSATAVTVSPTILNMKSGEKATLTATLEPEGTTDSVKEWTSSDTNIATVNNGEVTAIREGTAVITVKTTNDKTATCSVTVTCSHSNKTEVSAKAPTCTETGNNKYYVCDDCGKIYKADGVTETTISAETIVALGHDFSIEQKNETHHWKKCSRCDAISEKIQHNGNEWQNDENNHWKVCGCGVVIEKAAHTAGSAVKEKIIEATCQKTGSHDEVTYCTVCNKELSRTNVVDPKKEHTPAEPVKEHEVPATHATTGSYDEVIYCSVCKEELTRTPKIIEIIPHDGTGKSWESNETDHWKICGCGVIIEKAAHTPGDKVNEKIVAPKCTENGKHDEVVYCSVCHYEMSRTKDVVDNATGHKAGTPIKENEVAPTCTKEGSYDEVVYCSICGEELSRTSKKSEKTAHTPDEAVIENEVKSTVDKEGNCDEVTYCKDCGKELSRKNIITPKFVYEVLEGKDGEHKEETQSTLTFKVNGEFSKFTGLKIDDKEVDKSKYTVKSGSTVVTLLADYLNSLAIGTHKIAFVYDDGEVTTNFKVSEVVKDDNKVQETKQDNNNSETSNENKDTSVEEKTSTKINKSSVNTGDNSNIKIWTLSLLASAILFVITVKCIVKSRKSKH